MGLSIPVRDKKVRVKSKLKQLMDKQGVTRMDVVRGANLSYPTVVRWEEDRVKKFDPLTLAKLRDYFQCEDSEVAEILDDVGG